MARATTLGVLLLVALCSGCLDDVRHAIDGALVDSCDVASQTAGDASVIVPLRVPALDLAGKVAAFFGDRLASNVSTGPDSPYHATLYRDYPTLRGSIRITLWSDPLRRAVEYRTKDAWSSDSDESINRNLSALANAVGIEAALLTQHWSADRDGSRIGGLAQTWHGVGVFQDGWLRWPLGLSYHVGRADEKSVRNLSVVVGPVLELPDGGLMPPEAAASQAEKCAAHHIAKGSPFVGCTEVTGSTVRGFGTFGSGDYAYVVETLLKPAGGNQDQCGRAPSLVVEVHARTGQALAYEASFRCVEGSARTSWEPYPPDDWVGNPGFFPCVGSPSLAGFQ